MDAEVLKERFSRRLIRSGVLLFLLGLVTGLLVQMLANPRMALASHLEGAYERYVPDHPGPGLAEARLADLY